MNRRHIFFILSILIGIGIGLYSSWVLFPPEIVDTVPTDLRVDYRANYVLMVAETFHQDEDYIAAIKRLQVLGVPAEEVETALSFAVDYGYPPQDLILIQNLYEKILSWNPALEPITNE